MKSGTKIRNIGAAVSLCAIVFGCSNLNVLGPSATGEMDKTSNQTTQIISDNPPSPPMGTKIMTSNISKRTVDYMLWIVNTKDTVSYEFNPMTGSDTIFRGTVPPYSSDRSFSCVFLPSVTYPDSCGDTVRPRSKVYIDNSCDTFPNGTVVILK